ncbi:XRE family transcriptional regulator [Micromonospora sp. KC723]|nr:helix-turn-helix transcriptional regulator [Micromonospora sp. KC723]TDB75433.1 XRE family transcriptional regulator [Micromonospora sp. KC723]
MVPGVGRFSPTVRRRRLASELRRYREAAGLTLEQAARHIDSSHSRLSRIETGQSGIRAPDLKTLLEVYQVPPDEQAAMVTLARESRQRGWWRGYGDAVPDWFEVYVGLESEAAGLAVYESQFVHGLFQTEAYARAVYRAAVNPLAPDEIDRRVRLRMDRQHLVTEQGLRIRAVLDEAVLRRAIGGPEVLRDQLRRLLEIADLPNVSLQVLPFSAGACVLGPFTIIDFPGVADQSVIFVENQAGGIYLEKPNEVRDCTLKFDYLRAEACDTKVSATMIAGLVKEIS